MTRKIKWYVCYYKKYNIRRVIESDGNTSFLRAARAGHLDKVLEHLKSNIDINTSNANGLNALHLASKDGHLEVVAELLKRGAAVDAATKKGNTALHIASLAGQEEVVKLLVNHGASVNVQSQNGFTPLYMAAQENHDNVVKYLLANGANQTLATEDGFTPLAVAMQQGHDKVVTVLLENDTRGKVRLPALHIAAKKDDVKAAKLLLENDHNPDVTSKSGFTPLHIASHYGNEGIANLLIQKKADVNYAAKHNITPLHVAAKWGKTNMVAMLLEKGANIESKTRDGLTPLHCAARSGHEQVVDMLLERDAPISCKTKNGLAPLHMAAQGDHVDAARILLYHRAPVDEVTVDYLTALHVAAHCGHVRVAKLLLDRQADANARALNGFTPLHIACKKNRIKVVELLLKHGASISATTESGLTPLHVASFMGCMNIVIYLLQHDANPDVPTVRGETPLHLAARANQTDIIRILLRNGSQVDARAREQQTPLHIASRLGNVDIVMLLLQHGAKVDTATKDMYTALHIAAKEGQDEVAAVLIDNGASLNSTTKKGFTPLHLASKYGNIKVAKLLLQKEAPVDAQGKNGVTPLHVASHYDHQQVALLLLDKGASPHATAKNGHTPLHIAAKKNQMDIANTLLEYGAKPNAESKAGFTPLHLSAQEGHVDMTSLLIEHEADTNCQAKNGLTPLHLCAQEDRVPVAEVLVKNKAIIDKASKAGYTPLHVACHYGQSNMVKFLLNHGADVKSTTTIGYTPLHQAAQQGHTNIVNVLLENSAQPNAITHSGQTPLHIAQKLGYISVIDTLKVVTQPTSATLTTDEKYKVVAPEAMHETFMSDSEEEGGEDTMLGDHAYRYLTADEMKSLGDDSLPIDVTRDERIDSNRLAVSGDSNMLPPQAIEDSISPQQYQNNYSEYIKKYTPDNVDVARHPINIGFLVSFLVDARGGAMRGCRHSGVRVIVPPRSAGSPTRITCRYVRPQRTPHPPPLMEGEALASRVLELGPVGAKFLGPVIIEVPHFAALRGKEREIVILRSDNGETWREHTIDSSEDILNDVLNESFEAEDISQLEDVSSGRITRILTHDFPQYFAVVSRIRQEVHAIGPEGGMVSSTVVPQVQAVFPQGALTKKIKVGLQAQPIDPELTAKLLGHGVAVSPVVTVEPRRRKFHKAITLSMPAPRAHSQGMINQYSGSTPTLRLLCSITGGTTRAQWEDVTGSTPLTFVNDCVSFTTTVSARFWLMDCRNIGDATKMATELYREAIHVPFMAKFVVFAKRIDPLEARLRVFCMTDDKEDKTLEHQEHFTEVAKSRDVEVLEGKPQYVEFAGNLIPITKSGEQLQFAFRAFRENRLPFSVKVKDQHAEAIGRSLFMREAKVPKGDPPQQPICILNIVLPDDIVADTISLTDSDSIRRHEFLKDSYEYYRPDPRLADISNLLGEDWVLLATQLGLTTSEINVIKSEYPDSVAKQAQSMLRMWISQSSNRSQSNVLENALRRIGREDIIPQCLNEEPDIIKKEETVKYRIKKDISFEDRDIMKDSESVESLIQSERKEDRIKKRGSYDKYSAEEKVVEEPSDEEDFNKTVREKRELIEKRLSVERTIPASSQRVEIAQEISSIKRQSIVEDKIAEVETQKRLTPPEVKTIIDENIPSEKDTYMTTEQTIVKEITPEKQTTITTITTETRTIKETINLTHKTDEEKNDDLLENVAQRLETKKVVPKITTDADPRSPKLSKTPPPSPADFIIKEKAATVQEWEASREEAEEEQQLENKNQENIGLTSPSAKVKSEDSLDIVKADAHVDKLDNEKSVKTLNIKPPIMSKDISSETLTLIKTKEIVDPIAIKVEEKKEKKGIINTLKSFVTKSFDQSDSESEKSQEIKGKKKGKKSKSKSQLKNNETINKPKIDNIPLQEPEHFKNLPYVEVSPNADDNHEISVDIDRKEDSRMQLLENNKQTKDFNLDIHKGIKDIEDEILLNETANKKPFINIYDNETAPVISEPKNLLNDDDQSSDIKLKTYNLIQNEISFQGWADDKYNAKPNQLNEKSSEMSKSKLQPTKLFGFLSGKSSRDSETSEDDKTDKQKEIIEKQDKEDSKEIGSVKHDSKNSGIFDVFTKKGKKYLTKTPFKEDQNVDKELNVIMKSTNDFIDHEVKNYDNSSPTKIEAISKKTDIDETIVKKREKREKSTEPEKRRSGLLNFIFGKEENRIENETAEKLSKGTNEIVESSTIGDPNKAGTSSNIENTKQFLMNELTSYEDNEISNENTIAPSHETIEEPVKIKKGVFNLFSKKDAGPGKDEELHTKQTKNNMNELQVKKKIKSPLFSNKKEKIEIKLPESVLKDISECNSFLKLEIDNYYDEKILNEKLPEIIFEIPTVSPKKDSKKGIFNIFVKKERKDVDQNTNIKTNEDVIEDTKNKEPEIVTIAGNSKVQQFLDTEIINYDCPTGVKFAMVETTDKDTSLKASDSFDKTQEVIQSKETKTVDKAEKIIKEVIQETSQPIAIDIQQLSSSNLPNEDLHLRHDTDSFLKTEIINYHDVKSKVALKEDLQKNKEKYIFYKKSESTDKNEKKQKNKIKKESSDSADDSDSQTKSTKFSLFKKREKTQPVPEIIKEATPSENVVSYIVNTHGNIKSTQDFLQIEKTKYSDSKTSKVVDLENMDIKKPTTKSEKSKKLVLSESGDESDSCTKSSKFRLFGKPKKEKSVEKYEAEVSIVDKSPKSINKDKVINLPEIIPSEDIVSTNNFIQTEINNYEDVKLEPMQSSVNEPIIYSPESADESDKSAVKIHKSLFGKKVHKKHHTPTAKLDKGHDEDSKKYADNEKTKRKSSNKFKKGESSESGEESDGTKKSSKYKLFSRKKKADKEKTVIKEASSKEILDDSIIDSKVFTQNFLIEEVERYQDVKLMYPTNQESDVLDSIENKKIKFNLINKLIKKSKKEETDNKLEGHLLTVRDTTEFLSNEHTHYDDVKTFDPKNNITDELLHEGNEVIEQEQELLQKPQISTLNAEGPKPVIKVPDKKATPLSHDILVSMKNTQEFLTKEVSNYDGKDFNDKSKSNKVGDTGKKEVTFQTDQINTLKDVLTAVDLKSVSENSEISQKTILVKTIVFNSAQEVLDSSTDIENDIETEDEDKTQKIEIESKKDTLPSKKKKGIFTKMFLGKSKDQTSTEISASNDTDLEKNDEFTEKKIPKKSKGLLTKLSEKIGSVEKKFESTKGSVILKSVSGEYTPKEIVSTDSKGISEKPTTSCITQATEINHFLDHEKNNVFNGGLEQSNIEINDKEQLFDEPKNDFKDNAKAKETDVMKSKPDKKKNQGIFDKIFSSNKNKSKGDTSVPGEEKLVEGSQIKANDLEEPKDAIITKKEVSEKVKSASDKTISIKDTLKDTIKESDRKLKSDLERRIDRIDNSFATNLTDIKEETNKRLSETEKVNDDITLSVLNVLKDVDIVSEKTILMKDTLENKIKEGKTKIESDTKREIQSLDSSVSSELVEIKEYTKVESNNLLSSKEIVKEEVTSISTSFKTMGDTSANTILIKDDFIDKIQESKGELSSDLKQKLESLDIPVTSTFKETKENFKIQTDKLFMAEEIVKDETTHVTTSVITTFETKTISMKDIFEDKIKESKEKLESGLKEKLESAEDLVSSQLVDVQENFQSETHKLVSAKQMVKDEIAEIAPSTKATLTKVDDESAKVVSMKDNLKDIIEESKVKLESDLKEKCESIDSSISSKLVDIKKNIKGEAEKIISAKQFLDDKVEEIAVSTKESEENLESDLKKKPGYGDSTISSKLVDVKENIKSEAEKLVPAIKIVKDEIAAFAVSTKATLNKADDASAKTVLMMDNLKDKITDSKVALESDLKQKLENIDSSVSSKLVDIKKTIESENDKILSEKEVVKDKVTEIAASAEGTIKKVYDATVKTSSIKNNLEDTIKESKADLESDIKKKIETSDSLISSKLVDIKENIKDETNKILSTKETIKGDLTKITSSVKTGLKNVSDASILIKDDFKDKAEEIKGKFETDLGYELKTVESTVSSKIVDIKDNIKNETDKILLTEEIVKDKLAKNASSTLQKVDDKLSTTKIFFENTIIEGKARLESDLKQKLRAVDSSVPTQFIDIKENITSESDKILLEKESIKDEIASSVKTTLEKVDDASAKSITIKNNFVDKVQENQEKLKSDLEQKLDTVDASVSSKLVDIKENIQGETNKLLSEKEKIKEGIKEIGTTLKTGLTKFNEASISIKDNITDEVKNSKATLQSDLEQKLETVDASVSSKLIDIKENIKSKTDNILTSKESVKDEIKEIASSVKATLGKVDDVPGKTFETKNRLEDKIQDNKAKLESDLKLKLETVDASVSSNLEDIKGNIKGETKKLLSEKEKIKDEIKDIQSSVKIGLKHFDEPSFSIKNTFKDEVKESTVKLQSDLKQKLETVDSSVSFKLIDIKENVNSETDKILTSKENVKDEIRDIASAVKTTIGKVDDVSGKTFAIKNNFEEKIQENKAKLESDLQGKLEIVHASVSSKLEDIKGNIKGETNTLLSEEENIKGEIKDIESSVNIGLKNLYEAAVSKGTIKDDFKDGTIKLQSDLKQKVETVDSSVSSKLMDLKDNIERDINTKDSIEDEMKEIASSVKTNFRKVDDLSAIKNNFEEKNQQNKAKLESGLKQKLETVDASVSLKLEDIKGKIKGETNTLLSEKEKIKVEIKDIESSVKTGLKNLDEASVSIKGTFKDDFKEGTVKLQSDLKQKLETVDSSVSSKLIDIQEDIKCKTDKILPSKESVKVEIKKIASSVKATVGKMDDVSGKTFEMKNNFEDKIQDNKAKLESDLKQKLETVVSSKLEDIQGNIKGETNKLCSKKEKIKGDIKDIESSVKIGLTNLDEASVSITDTFKGEVKESSVKLQSDLKQKQEIVDSSISSKLMDIKENIKCETNNLRVAKENVQDGVKEIESSIKSTLEKIYDASAETITKQNNFSDKIKGIKINLESNLKQKFETIDDSISSKLVDVKESIKDETTKLLSEKESIKEEIKDIGSSVKTELRNLDDEFISIKNEVKESKAELGSDLKQKHETFDSTVVSNLVHAKERIKDETDQQVSSNESVGTSNEPKSLSLDLAGELISTSNQNNETKNGKEADVKRSPIFRIESEEEVIDISLDRRDSVRSNILEIISDQQISEMVTELDMPGNDTLLNEITNNKIGLDLKEKTMDDSSKIDKTEKKLKRVEKKFERMASEIIEQENSLAKELNITSPEMETKRDSEFKNILSQLSTEEVADLQKEYSTLWDEQTFSHTDEWDSKTPESQAEVIDLPQGETSSRGTRQENEKQSGSQAESDEAFADVETTIRSATSETINSKQTPKPKEETDKE